MTRTKAVEILKLAISDPDMVDANDLVEAQQLGVEALENLQLQRQELTYHGVGPLPSEDPDDCAQPTFEHQAPKTIYHKAWAAVPAPLPGEKPQ
ncbi:hypothetical protein ES708_12336 [subsurface metagenome]